MIRDNSASAELAETITRSSSKQTYYTLRVFADRDLVADSYRAYAYFRWVDDRLDEDGLSQSQRIIFLQQQKKLLVSCLDGVFPDAPSPEEAMLVDLFHRKPGKNDGLQAYLQCMMAVMEFYVQRRGRLISQEELDQYTGWLAVAVTENLHYFIGNRCAAPVGEQRYIAVTAAHITHMLRDTLEDVEKGYFNIPREYLAEHQITAGEVKSPAYREWVHQRVKLARDYFRQGEAYLSQVQSLRCRVAGWVYVARFAYVLDLIEKDGYRLRHSYPERKQLDGILYMLRSVLTMLLCRPVSKYTNALTEL